MFFFDAYLFAKKIGAMETLREEEFAPVKNPPEMKNSTAVTARKMMSNLFKKWLLTAGINNFKDTKEDDILEIPFSLSYDGENLDYIKQRIKSEEF